MNIYGFRATDDEESYTWIAHNLIVCNLFSNILSHCYRFSVVDAIGLHFHCTQLNCIQFNWRKYNEHLRL